MVKKSCVQKEIYEWTNRRGTIMVLRSDNVSGVSRNGFQHPSVIGDVVTAKDFNESTDCGGGIHGWAWGVGVGDGKNPDWATDIWRVYEVEPKHIVGRIDGGIKVKFKTGILRFIGSGVDAWRSLAMSRNAWIRQCPSDHEHVSRNGAHTYMCKRYASADVAEHFSSMYIDFSSVYVEGVRSNADTLGLCSIAHAKGYESSASAKGPHVLAYAEGYNAHAFTTGDRSSAHVKGDGSTATASGFRASASATGEGSTAIVHGAGGRVKCSKYGGIMLTFYDKRVRRNVVRAAEIGCGSGLDGKLKSDTWYTLDRHNNFIEAKL